MPSYPGWSQLGVLVPARLRPVPLLPAELAGMLALPPRMSFSADPALVFLLLRILVPRLRDLVDPVGLLECALLGDVVGLLAQDTVCPKGQVKIYLLITWARKHSIILERWHFLH